MWAFQSNSKITVFIDLVNLQDEKQSREQACFIKGYSTSDDQILHQIVETSNECCLLLYRGFIDDEKALNIIEQFAIYEALRKIT